MHLEQLDVMTAFLHVNLEEVIYMRQPPGYEQDDMLIACKSKVEIGSTKSLLNKEFDMKELGEAKKILGNGKSVKIPLDGHFKLALKDWAVRDCDVERISKVPYANVVESLMYLMLCTRPDIAYAVLEAKTVEVLKATTKHNVVDTLTKVVPGLKLQHCLELLNVVYVELSILATTLNRLERSILNWDLQVVLPPKTAEEILARERERKVRTTLLMALPEDHLAKFHKMTDAKEMWEAIKSRFGGNDESKKMQKYILKQQFEGFSVSNSEGLHKGYDRFQSLLSQLEIHGAGVSTEDANQKFLRSLPSAWSQVSLIMRTKPGVDSLSFDDLYNNLRVFESDVKGSTASSSSTQNVAFVFENTSSTNEWSTIGSSQLDHEDLEQLDEFDLEEMDLKWQVAMISIRLKKFYKKTGHFARECRSKGNQDSRRRDAWNIGNKGKDNERRSGKQEEPKALVTLDGDGVDWTSHSEDEQEIYALMAYNNSGSDTEAYTQALKKVEAQLVVHQQNQLWYEEEIRFMKIDLDDKIDVLTYHKKLLAEAEKEKEELKAKVEKWHNSSKSLNILLNSQMSVRDKAGLGYGDQMNKGVLSYENEVFGSLFYSRSSDIEVSPVNDRYAEGMHAVPPPMIRIYIPSGLGKEIDESQFTYGPKQSKPSESEARSSDFNSCESNSSEETLESMPEPVVNEPKVVSQPKVWFDAPIIEEYESDSDDDYVTTTSKEQEQPSFAFINTVYPQRALKNKGIVDSGCSRHMTRNKAYLAEYQDYNGGPVAFGGSCNIS
ncbi:hypothetical protein Tco_0168374 [Tanacetum coccineum]